MTTESQPLPQNAQLGAALIDAAAALEALNAAGIRVIAALANGRRPLLMVERMPEGVVSVVKRKHPNGCGGYTVVRATQWCGCQLEAMHDELPPETRVQQCGRALEVVRG